MINDLLPNLIHLGALLYMVCFLFRNQVLLRTFAILGDFAYISYFFTITDRPLWEAIAWASANVVINLIMIGLVLRDQREGVMPERDLQLFRRFSSLNAGEFRRLMKLGAWNEVDSDRQLTAEGSALEHLYYVVEGDVIVEKQGRHIHPEKGLFIGEIAFLNRQSATASVTVKNGAKFITWESKALRLALEKDAGLKQGFMQLINADLVQKVARA